MTRFLPHEETENPKNEGEIANKLNKTCRCRDYLLYLHSVFIKTVLRMT